MKTLLAIFLGLILSCSLHAGPTNNITLTWDWTDGNTNGYVYVGNASRSYQTNYFVSTNVWATFIPISRTLYFTVTAVNEFGDQSEYGNELCVQRIKPSAPNITKYTITTK